MTLGNRIKQLRKTLGLTQQEFADKLKVSRSNIATYEVGKNNPADAVNNLICREFNVSEQWLRTGEGEMFLAKSRADELADFMNDLMRSEPDDIRRRFVTAVSRLSTKELEVLENAALHLVEGMKPSTAQPEPLRHPSDEMTREELHDELDRQLLLEKGAATFSASSPPSSGSSEKTG